jgi:hypothetical protein
VGAGLLGGAAGADGSEAAAMGSSVSDLPVRLGLSQASCRGALRTRLDCRTRGHPRRLASCPRRASRQFWRRACSRITRPSRWSPGCRPNCLRSRSRGIPGSWTRPSEAEVGRASWCPRGGRSSSLMAASTGPGRATACLAVLGALDRLGSSLRRRRSCRRNSPHLWRRSRAIWRDEVK